MVMVLPLAKDRGPFEEAIAFAGISTLSLITAAARAIIPCVSANNLFELR